MTATVDQAQLETKVKAMYQHVAEESAGRFHFELGERVALRAGYDPDRLAAVPQGAVESFAGVGSFFDLAALVPGETVVDLGSGSGMDAIVCNADLYLDSIRAAGFTVDQVRVNACEFISGQARNASTTYGVKSISLLVSRTAA